VRSCAIEEDCEGVANYALSIAEVEAAVFMRELPDNRVRLSLRSKGRINVAAIAEGLDGGGHENASGCMLPGPLSRACAQILGELRAGLASVATRPG
jgi:phosphoesterase RecJ-like protein